MAWQEVINDPTLKNLPFKIELNKFGKLLMSPASNEHGRAQFNIGKAVDKKSLMGKLLPNARSELQKV